MRRNTAFFMALVLIFTLCACKKTDDTKTERACGVFITVEAADIYAISCGTDSGSDSFQNEDNSAIAAGTTVHFDFAGSAAEKDDEYTVDYSISIKDSALENIELKSFSDNFASMARIDLVVTAGHHIIYKGAELTCGGDTIVKIVPSNPADGVSLSTPEVVMGDNEEAANAINGRISDLYTAFTTTDYDANTTIYYNYIESLAKNAEKISFNMSRSAIVTRGDSAVLSLKLTDTIAAGADTDGTSALGCNFSAEDGSELHLADITSDLTALKDACAKSIQLATVEEERFKSSSMVFNAGYIDAITNLVADGNWYFGSTGIVFIANPGTITSADKGLFLFTVPYSDLEKYIDAKWLPGETAGERGEISGAYTGDFDASKFTLVGDSSEDMVSPFLITVTGNIYNISVYQAAIRPDTGAVSVGSQLWYCSNLSEGAVFAVDRALLTATPTTMICFTAPDGSFERRLVTISGKDGSIFITDPDVDGGLVITDELPYSVDLDADGTDEAVSTVKSGTGTLTLNIKSGAETFTAQTEITGDAALRLYDLDGDGKTELIVSGSAGSDKAATYCFTFDGKLSAVKFGTEDHVSGLFKTFDCGRLVVSDKLYMVGTHAALYSYCMNDGALTLSSSATISFDTEEYLTLAKALPIPGGTIDAGTRLRLTGTNGSDKIYIITDTGGTGLFEVETASDGALLIDGNQYNSYFENID